MNRIIAIGGGEIGRPGQPIQTTKIDKEIIKLTGKKKPKILFIPTASNDSEGYFNVVTKHFGKRLGCSVDVLNLLDNKISKKEIEQKIFRSDALYVGGGNTLKLMIAWRKKGIDKIIKKAISKGIVLSGISAGAICWFKQGNSDSRRITNPSADLIKVKGLNLVNALFCPHYDFEKNRKKDLKKMMKKTSGIAIAIDNCCAIEIVGKWYRIISSKKDANAYKVYWKAGKYYQNLIEKKKEFYPLPELLKK
ncbi:type 1 glutamine amidotransferase-like domain-containing protein [Candidatus Woesearchaeota archaeon]|jgi:dipeptidase E|nr:type 1 glutamine amidotransferase-like domain-containing protein [Candidatus Woesearchaeota archaeon]